MDLLYKNSKTGLKPYLSRFPHQGGIIVNDERKFIFMRAGKVAGTSVLNAFRKAGVDFFYVSKHPERYNKWFQTISDEELEDYFIFSVVRNPFDRFISSARYLKIPVRDLAANFQSHIQDEIVYLHTLPLYQYTHLQHHLFADYICKVESLQFDLNQVFDYLKIKRVELSVSNRSNRKDYPSYYDQELIEKVSQLYREDIACYGYSFSRRGDHQNSRWAYFKERFNMKKKGLANRLKTT